MTTPTPTQRVEAEFDRLRFSHIPDYEHGITQRDEVVFGMRDFAKQLATELEQSQRNETRASGMLKQACKELAELRDFDVAWTAVWKELSSNSEDYEATETMERETGIERAVKIVRHIRDERTALKAKVKELEAAVRATATTLVDVNDDRLAHKNERDRALKLVAELEAKLADKSN